MMQNIRTMETRNIDEIIILDVNATPEKRPPLFEEIKEFTKELYCPVTIGGGIYTLDDVGRLIQHCGADKVAICTAALHDPQLIENAAHKYGSQAIVGVINVLRFNGNYATCSGDSSNILDTSPIGYGLALEELGVGEILLSSILNNGLFVGYDTELIEQMSDVTKVPIIANGGCGKPLDMVGAIAHGASAAAASSMFLFTHWTPKDCARELQEAGLPARVE
jgi:cyclase